jgi:hypothetical protein
MQWKQVERRSAASAVRSTSRRGPSAAPARPRDLSPPGLDALEPRVLFAVSLAFDGLFNTAKFPGNQSETAVALNHTNPNNIFVAANYGAFKEIDQGPNDPIAETGIFTSATTDGGATWTPRVIATDNTGPLGIPDGVSDDGFPIACCDPSAAFDDFGNLFFVYLAGRPGQGNGSQITVLLSTDGGQTFATLINFRGGGANPLDPADLRGGLVDRCEVTTGTLPDGTAMVAVSFVDFDFSVDAIQCVMAPIGGLGQVGTWTAPVSMQFSGAGTGDPVAHNIAHLQISPTGGVAVAHQQVGLNPVDNVYVNIDPDGLGPQPFGNAVFIDSAQLTFFEPLPGQPVRGVAAVPTLAYDRSNGPFRGRLYLAYAQAVTEQRTDSFGFPLGSTTDSNIVLRWSDDNGANWSQPVRVNDDPVLDVNSQFFQRVAVDPVTGNVAVGWLDSRDDVGDGDEDDEIGYYATVGQPAGNGIQFAPNLRLNVGLSNARFSGNFGNDYGDYTALDFYNNVLWASWPDNSNSTGDNPAGSLRSFDIYAARVRVTDVTVPQPPFITPGSPLAPTVVKPQSIVKKGKFYQLKMTYSHPSGIQLATVDSNDLVVTGPNLNQPMQLIKAKSQKKGTRVAATYRLAAPGGTWDSTENAVYTVTLQEGAVSAVDGTTTVAGTVTNFLVNAKPPKQAGAGREIVPASAPPAAASVFSAASILSGDDDESLRLV